MKKLLIVRGISGSGKSTFVEDLVSDDIEWCEADWYFGSFDNYKFDHTKLKDAHAWCQCQIESHMKNGTEKVVVSNTFTTEREMKPYLNLAEKYGYTVFTVVVEKRNENKDVHNVPEETRQKQAERLSKSIKLI